MQKSYDKTFLYNKTDMWHNLGLYFLGAKVSSKKLECKF